MPMPKSETTKYLEMAKTHAEFLTKRVFEPVFIMGFIHGVKHMFEEKELESRIKKKEDED